MKLRRLLSEYKFKYLMHRDLSATFRMLKKQEPQSFVLMEAHRLEKSMCQAKQEKGRGYDRAINLLNYIETLFQIDKERYAFAIETAVSVIDAFCNYKENTEPDHPQLQELKQALYEGPLLSLSHSQWGGFQTVSKPEDCFESAQKLFSGRHSCRSFSNTPLDMKKLEKAIELALMAPSACNRQPCKCYVISDEKLVAASNRKSNDYLAPYHLVVAVDCTAYSLYEFNDWIVTSSIFAGYLSLALHSVGIGACIMRKPLYENDAYVRLLKKECKIPANEKIILELYIGNYADWFLAPISRRKRVESALVVIDDK